MALNPQDFKDDGDGMIDVKWDSPNFHIQAVHHIDTIAPISGGPLTSNGQITTLMNPNSLIGRFSPDPGVMEEIKLGPNLKLENGILDSSGGGGGSPAGTNGNIQFNDEGNFGGSDNLTWNKDTTTLSGEQDLTIATSDKDDGTGTGAINILEGNDSGQGGFTKGINITGGSATDPSGNPGPIFIIAGNSGGTGGPPFLGNGLNPGANVDITAGSTGLSTGGNVSLTSGSARGNTGVSGVINIGVGRGGGAGNGYVFFKQLAGGLGAVPNIFIGRPADTPSFGSGQGVLEIHNRSTTPTTNAVNGGLLYVEGGALKYRGSLGTVTEIAPA